MKLLLLLFTINVGVAHAASYAPQDLLDGYVYLNQIRIKTGMTEFASNSQLEQAAFNHANYLADNFLTGHYESNGTTGFTGVDVKDRVIFAGYQSTFISENVSSGNSESKEAIDNLMSAIYHRLGFLDFVNNEVGIGIGQISTPNFHSAYVFNMGNFEYNSLCQGSDFTGFGVYVYGVCEPDIRINEPDFTLVASQAQGNNPYIVQWPADGDNDVPPAFFEEFPDPLPDYSVSGYPISLQFNPLTFTNAGVDVAEFKIYREFDNQELQPTRLLTNLTDPNEKLSALEYALFPLKRLDWETAYRVEAKYVANSNVETLIWRFTTKDLGMPLYTVQGIGEEILLAPTTEMFAFYVPPTTSFPDLGGRISYSYSSGMSIATEFEDGNTVLVNILGEVGQQAAFKFSGERNFTVKISSEVIDETISNTNANETVSITGNKAENIATIVDTCEPVTISAHGKMHIPALTYTASEGTNPLILQANLEFVNNLSLRIINYEPISATDCATWVTVSPELKMHISTLHFTPFANNEIPWVSWANLEYRNGLFELVNVGFK